MLVCSCFAVSDRTLWSVIDSGARDAKEIGERCDAGTGCGGCLEEIDEMLQRRCGGLPVQGSCGTRSGAPGGSSAARAWPEMTQAA